MRGSTGKVGTKLWWTYIYYLCDDIGCSLVDERWAIDTDGERRSGNSCYLSDDVDDDDDDDDDDDPSAGDTVCVF